MRTSLRQTRNTHWFLQRTLFAGLLFCLAATTTAGRASTISWQTKVDSRALQDANAGRTEFLVFLQEQADLGGAIALPTKLEKGTYVFEKLSDVASRSQGPVLKALEKMAGQAGDVVEYRAYWVVNAIWVRGDANVLVTLARRVDVAHIYANPKVKLDLPDQPPASLVPDVPQGVVWNINKVRAPLVWAVGDTGQGIVVGGADTGYAWTHPALKNKYRGWNGVSANHNYSWHDAIHSDTGSCPGDSLAPCDPYGHGTHTMGIMVGDDGLGNQIGMAPGARWVGCRNMDHFGNGTPASYIECFQWFIAPTDLSGSNPNPAMAPDVINNSWGCPTSEGCTDPNILKSTVEAVRAAGILTVQSAGNEGSSCNSVSRPAAIYEASFTVGNTDLNDMIASTSSRGSVTVDGSSRLKPDVSAPGQSILSSIPPNGYASNNGTSMAAPHVAGLAALLMSARPDLIGQIDKIETIIEKSAIPRTISQTCGGVPGSSTPNNTYGWGRIDAWNSYRSLFYKLELSKEPFSKTFDLRRPITYTLQVTNTNPFTPTSNVIISDTIPADTQFLSASNPYTRVGDTIIWQISLINPSQSKRFVLAVKPLLSAGQVIVNDNYAAKSNEAPLVIGAPVFVQRGLNYFYPWVQTYKP